MYSGDIYSGDLLKYSPVGVLRVVLVHPGGVA